MLLLFHIIIASISILFTIILFLRPTIKKMYLHYFLVGLVLATGTILVIQQPTHMTQTCFTGLLYIAFVTTGVFLARHKLAKATKA